MTESDPFPRCLKVETLPTRVLLVDDCEAVRDWLKTVLESKGYQVDGEAASGKEGVALALRLQPDVVVMDFKMPTLNGLDAAKEILRELPATRVIIFTTYADRSDVREGLSIGIRGFAPKSGKSEDVLRAINQVLTGKTYVGPGF
jgi:two-component system, NarL family, response regulator DesR